MYPCCSQYCTNALPNNRNILRGYGIGGFNMLNERLNIFYTSRKTRCIATFTRRFAVTAGIPCKKVKVRKIEFFNQMCHPPRVLMSTVKHDNRFFLRIVCRSPVLIEQGCTIVAGKILLTIVVMHVL